MTCRCRKANDIVKGRIVFYIPVLTCYDADISGFLLACYDGRCILFERGNCEKHMKWKLSSSDEMNMGVVQKIDQPKMRFFPISVLLDCGASTLQCRLSASVAVNVAEQY